MGMATCNGCGVPQAVNPSGRFRKHRNERTRLRCEWSGAIAQPGIDELIERSSLGTPQAKRIRSLTPPAVAESIVARSERLAGAARQVTHTACSDRPIRPHPVTKCGECPFAWDGTDMEDVWRCTAADRGTHFRALPKGNPWEEPPPKWCPLGQADRLVQLRRAPEVKRKHRSARQCDLELRRTFQGAGQDPSQAANGYRWECSCGRTFEHVCDEAEGCSWSLVDQAVPA